MNKLNFGSKAGKELLINGYENFLAIGKLQSKCITNGETPLSIYVDDAIKEIPEKLDIFEKNLPEGNMDELDVLILGEIRSTCFYFTKTLLDFSTCKEEASMLHNKMKPVLQKIDNIFDSKGGLNSILNPRICTDEEDIKMLESLRGIIRNYIKY
jgi:hypothetical protein